MSRNVESRFSVNPTRIDISRSTFSRNSSLKTSFNVGQLIPFYIDEVLPGDTFKIKTSKVVRLQTLLTPIMDNIYLDTYWFFVPNRLTWQHWKEFNGENTESAWVPQTEYQIPQVSAPEGGWQVGSLADYFGVPVGKDISVSALPFRAYSLICNEWFRDENLQDPFLIPLDDTTQLGSNGDNYITDCSNGGMPFIASKYHDYFTSCLPAPQKGPDVTVPINVMGEYPVQAGDTFYDNLGYYNPMVFSSLQKGTEQYSTIYPSEFSDGTVTAFGGHYTDDVNQVGSLIQQYDNDFMPNNLYAINTGSSADLTINQLRLAFQIQKLYERDARGGSRYVEIIKSHFGVTSPDARLQRPEYLGGNRIPIHVSQVIQNSASGADITPQGTVTGMSLTTDVHYDFTKSFTEHGFVIGLLVARYPHTYQQGLERMWSRKDRFDFYWPVFANIGEQPVYVKEIFVTGGDVSVDDKVFGYQEAWADYRYKPSRVTGEMRSDYAQSLDVWHLADDYSSRPSLSSSWIQEDKSNVDRVLSVTSDVSNQLFADIYIENKTTRPMPVYSIPGLIDHH